MSLSEFLDFYKQFGFVIIKFQPSTFKFSLWNFLFDRDVNTNLALQNYVEFIAQISEIKHKLFILKWF